MVLRTNVLLCLLAIFLCTGCGSERTADEEALKKMAGVDELQETVPVSGKVTVDGTPTDKIYIFAYTKESGNEPAFVSNTNAEGKYFWTTYVGGDGLPPGEYQLAFALIPNEGKGDREGEDLLNHKYRNPRKNPPEFTLVVKSGEPQTDVDYALEK